MQAGLKNPPIKLSISSRWAKCAGSGHGRMPTPSATKKWSKNHTLRNQNYSFILLSNQIAPASGNHYHWLLEEKIKLYNVQSIQGGESAIDFLWWYDQSTNANICCDHADDRLTVDKSTPSACQLWKKIYPGDVESPLSQLHKSRSSDPHEHKILSQYSITEPSETNDEQQKSERRLSMLELTGPDSRHPDMKVGDVRRGIPIEVERLGNHGRGIEKCDCGSSIVEPGEQEITDSSRVATSCWRRRWKADSWQPFLSPSQ